MTILKRFFLSVTLLLCCGAPMMAQGPLDGGSFFYQGVIRVENELLNGTVDLQFHLYDSADPTQGQELDFTALAGQDLNNGIVNARLSFDPALFDGSERWLEVWVKEPADASYTVIEPLTEIVAVPYALAARTAMTVGFDINSPINSLAVWNGSSLVPSLIEYDGGVLNLSVISANSTEIANNASAISTNAADIVTAQSAADAAQRAADTAQTTADSAVTAAGNAQGAADAAQNTADAAATAAGTAQSAADTAQATADSAATAAGNAQSTADSAATAAGTAQSAADTAQATADNAATAAGTAQTTADNAATAAGNAQSTADNAATAAGNAQSTADNAATAAGNAQSTADSAVTAAGNAQATADFSENLLQNSSGSNTAVGIDALLSNDNGNKNTALGVEALVSNSSGSRNTAVGHKAQQDNVDGRRNTAVGVEALEKNIDGEYNIALGFRAGRDVEGDENIMIGHRGDPDDHHTIRLGGDDDADHERTFIAGIRGVTTGYDDAVAVVIDSEGQLGTISSSLRYKEQVEEMSIHSAPLLKLRPVIFRYREAFRDGTRPIQYGLIAEEVAQVFPELVVFNAAGKPETVKYQLLSSLLLNEFLKLSDRHQDEIGLQQQQIDALQQRVLMLEGLAARLAKLESRIGTPASSGEGN